jgi:uncharacterized protein (DUF433 family)
MNCIRIDGGGKVTIRNTGILVEDLLERLAAGENEETLLAAMPGLERDDFGAVLRYCWMAVCAGRLRGGIGTLD